MKNHYKIIGVNKNATAEDIKKETKKKLKLVNESGINIYEKKKYIDQLSDSFNILKDYHSRRELDEYLENKLHNTLVKDSFFKFPESLFNLKDITNVPEIKTSGKNSYYSYSSYSSSKRDKNGDITIENKFLSNNNGKLDGKHTITTKDKLGNDIIKEIPINKKTFKLDYKI